jgi:hypothetical protein
MLFSYFRIRPLSFSSSIASDADWRLCVSHDDLNPTLLPHVPLRIYTLIVDLPHRRTAQLILRAIPISNLVHWHVSYSSLELSQAVTFRQTFTVWREFASMLTFLKLELRSKLPGRTGLRKRNLLDWIFREIECPFPFAELREHPAANWESSRTREYVWQTSYLRLYLRLDFSPNGPSVSFKLPAREWESRAITFPLSGTFYSDARRTWRNLALSPSMGIRDMSLRAEMLEFLHQLQRQTPPEPFCTEGDFRVT